MVPHFRFENKNIYRLSNLHNVGSTKFRTRIQILVLVQLFLSQVVIDTVPSMMNALRMVWIISRHYNNDERMVPLMERIAWELAERVARVIQVRTIYK